MWYNERRQNFYKRGNFILVPETKEDESLDKCTKSQDMEILVLFFHKLASDYYFVLQLQDEEFGPNNFQSPF